MRDNKLFLYPAHFSSENECPGAPGRPIRIRSVSIKIQSIYFLFHPLRRSRAPVSTLRSTPQQADLEKEYIRKAQGA